MTHRTPLLSSLALATLAACASDAPAPHEVAVTAQPLPWADPELPPLGFGATGPRVTDARRPHSTGLEYPDPVVLTGMKGFAGGNPAAVRTGNVRDSWFDVFIEEETSADAEIAHLAEDVGYLAAQNGSVLRDRSGRVIGEVWTQSFSQSDRNSWHTVSPSRSYSSSAVVIASLMSDHGPDPSHVRIRDWDGTSFRLIIEEWGYLNGAHTGERVALMVVEAGEHELDGMVRLRAGQVSATDAWKKVTHGAGTVPVVLSQCMTYNGADPVVTRQRNLAADGFELRLQEEEGRNGVHTTETLGWVAVWGDPAAGLSSRYFARDARALHVAAGEPYQMDVADFRDDSGDVIQGQFAFKVVNALHMLGYDTEMDYSTGIGDHVEVLDKFQRDHGLPVQTLLDAQTLRAIDGQLAAIEPAVEATARRFAYYGEMRPLHGNMVTTDWVAALQVIATEALPLHLRPDVYEVINCIRIQCLGRITEPNGDPYLERPVDPADDFRVEITQRVGPHGRTPSAAADVQTLLHELAHYLDGATRMPEPGLPLQGYVESRPFYELNYDLTGWSGGCATAHSPDPEDFISAYGRDGGASCPAGMGRPAEEFAEAFAFYVTAGRDFRAATNQSSIIAAKYAWLRDQVFHGREYDTDLTAGYPSGCNDVPSTIGREPGYLRCDHEYVWDRTLPLLQEGTLPCPDTTCDDGAACTDQDMCVNGRCEGVTLPGCYVGQWFEASSPPSDFYAQAQSFTAPARTLTRAWLYVLESANASSAIDIVESLPAPSAETPNLSDPEALRAVRVGRLFADAGGPGWLNYEARSSIYLRPGHTYYLLREVEEGTFDSPYTWARSASAPHPGPFPDGTGYVLHRTAGWMDWRILPAEDNHYDYTFLLTVD